jgi:uncharacterized protein (PEP-CTERM system associated)
MVKGPRPDRRRAVRPGLAQAARGAALTGTLALGFATTAFAQIDSGGSGAASGAPAASAYGTAGTASSQTGGAAAGIGGQPGSDTGLFGGALGSGISLPNLFGDDMPVETPAIMYGLRTVASLSDNENRARSGREKADLRLEASPWIQAVSEAPRASYEVTYQMRNFFRLRNTDFDLANHTLDGSGSFALVGDRLWLDASAFMGSIGPSTDAGLTYDPTTYTNSSTYRTFSLSPWYQDQLGSWATYNLRYRYRQSFGRDSLLLADRSHEGTAALNGIDRGSRWNWGWQGYVQRSDYNLGINRERRRSSFTLFYRVSNTLRVSGAVEYEQIDFVFGDEGEDHGWGPGIGIFWTPNSRASFDLSVSERYYGTVGSANARWTTRRTTLGLAYARSVITNSQDLLFNLDPRFLTGGSGIENPILDDLGSRGVYLPGITTQTGALISDTAMFDERLTGYFALRGAGRALTLTVYASDRSSTNQLNLRPNPGSGIRGGGTSGQPAPFRGDVREFGATLAFHQTLDASSRMEAALERRQVDSPTVGFENQLDTLRAGVITDLTTTTRAFAGVRHSVHDAEGNRGVDYTENVVFVGFDLRFR